jgi:hypothetical protein
MLPVTDRARERGRGSSRAGAPCPALEAVSRDTSTVPYGYTDRLTMVRMSMARVKAGWKGSGGQRMRNWGSGRFAWTRRTLRYRPFLILLGLGAGVRLAAMVLYFPAWLQSLDELRFSALDPTGLFNDIWSPAGYTAFAAGLREVIPELWVTIAVQHVVGLSIGVFIFLAMRRLGVKQWIACVPAGVAFLSGDQIWMEHQVVAETFMTAALAAGLACAIRGLVPHVDLRWLAVASALLMYAGMCRTVGFVALPVLFLYVAISVKATIRVRIRALSTVVLPALVLLGVYVGAFEVSGGRYLGLTDMSGWYLYARAAPFADCDRFTPPQGTQQLCESEPEQERDGSLGYQWDLNSRGRKAMEFGPRTSATVGAFAREAIIHEPFSYLKAVVIDLGRYVDPQIGEERPYSALTHETQSFANSDPVSRRLVEEIMSHGYEGATAQVAGGGILSVYQELFRVGGLLIAAAVILTLLGMAIARGPLRLGIVLFGATGMLMYLIPAATFAYEVRYGMPPVTYIVTSGVLSIVAIAARLGRGIEEPNGDDSSPLSASSGSPDGVLVIG